MNKLRRFNMRSIDDNTLWTIIIISFFILMGFIVVSIYTSDIKYRDNMNRIEKMKIPDEAKIELAKKLTDDYIARKKK